MGFKSAKNTHNVKQSNGKYEVDGITFYSKLIYENIKSIDEYLSLLYPTDSVGENIIYSNVRNDEKYFDEILGRVEELIQKINKIDDWFINDLYKEKIAFSFLNKFKGIFNCFKEYEILIEKYECMDFEFENNFQRRIVDIKMGLSYMGINLFYE